MRKSGIVLGVVGLLLIAMAAVLRLWIVPAQAQVPSDLDKARQYSGTYGVMLNPAALQSGNLSTLFLRNVPVTIDRTVKVTDTDGESAIVNDARLVKSANGAQLSDVNYNFAVDRKTLEPVPAFGGAEVTAAKGLTVSWPFGTDKKDYTAYVTDTQGTVTAKYSGETTLNGLDTYLFKTSVRSQQVTEPKVLASLPTALPKSMLSAMPKALGYTDQQAALFAQLLSAMPDPVPITYLYSAETSLWVEPNTGAIVNTTKTESRQAVLAVPGSSELLPLTTVSSLTYVQTPASVSDAVSDAKDAANKLTLFGTTLPLIGVLVGMALIVTAAFLRKPRAAVPSPGPEHEAITPTKTE